MPRLISIAERNDVPSIDTGGTVNPGGSFLVQGITRAGTSSTGVGSWFQGTYGALLLNADGGYTYRLNDQDPDTDVLAAGQVAEDRFTYSYTQNGVAHTDTITVQVSGIDEPGQQMTATDATLSYATPTVIGALTQIVSTAQAGVSLTGYGDLFQSINRGSIRVGGSGAAEARGVDVSVAHWLSYAAFQNDGRIDAIAGLEGQGAIGITGSSAAPLVNNGVVHAQNSAQGTYYLVRAVGISAGPHDGTIINNGVVEAVSANGDAFGIWTSGLRLTVRNTGLIYVSGGYTEDPLGIVGIRSGQSSGVLIDNSGTIQVQSTRGLPTVGISIFRDSPNVYPYGTIINSGTIVADTAIMGYAGYSTGIHVTNSGHIEGALDFDTGMNIVSNLPGGTWIGDLRLGILEDVVRNGGYVRGNVTLGVLARADHRVKQRN